MTFRSFEYIAAERMQLSGSGQDRRFAAANVTRRTLPRFRHQPRRSETLLSLAFLLPKSDARQSRSRLHWGHRGQDRRAILPRFVGGGRLVRLGRAAAGDAWRAD